MDNRHIRNPKSSNTHLQNGNNLNNHVEGVDPDAVSYTDGYVHGRAVERSVETERQEIRAENTANRGLLLGIGLTALVGAVAGTIFYLNQRQEPVTPVVVPVPSTREQPNQETKIIERTTESTQPSVPNNTPPLVAPQQSQPDIKLPDIKVIVPKSEQKQTPSQDNTNSQTTPTQTQNQEVPNSSFTPPNTSTTTQPNSNTNNQSSPASPEIQIPTVRTTTESSDTINQSPTQSDNSNSTEGKTN